MANQKWALTQSAKNDWEIIGVNTHWAIEGWSLIHSGNYYYVRSPKTPKRHGLRVKKAHVLQRLFNLFEEPNKKEMRGINPDKILSALEVNYEAIRQLWLDVKWN